MSDPWIDAFKEWKKTLDRFTLDEPTLAIGFQAGYIRGHMDAVMEAQAQKEKGLNER